MIHPLENFKKEEVNGSYWDSPFPVSAILLII